MILIRAISPKIEGMVPIAGDIKKFFSSADIIVDNYDIYIERRK